MGKKSTKLTALLTAGVLVTSAFVGGTFARYITTTMSEDSARVAVWGINADEVEMNLFASEYDANGNKVAKSWNGAKIIAPGTSMSSLFSIVNLDGTLAPEVMYEIKVNVDDTEIDQDILDNPFIQWKLDDNAYGTWADCKADILALSGDPSGVKTYAPLEIAEEFTDGKTHTIFWRWMLDDNNIQDTKMGNDAVDRDIEAKIVVKVTARQVNGENNIQNEPVEHSGIIPEGAIYYREVTSNQIGDYSSYLEKLEPGDEFPEPETGDVYLYNGYEYRYEKRLYDGYGMSNPEEFLVWDDAQSVEVDFKWSAIHLDKNGPVGEILSSINGEPITCLDYAFLKHTNITVTPRIPDSVIAMTSTFQDCPNIATITNIPDSVRLLSYTFKGNFALTSVPAIPSLVQEMNETFLGCSALSGQLEVNTNNLEYWNIQGTLYDTNITEIIGTTTFKDELLATR